jgi:hypothetical protein
MEDAFPPRNLRKDPYSSFIRTDGVWLEVRNRKEECCVWSLIAITSHILSLTLTTFLRLVVRSLSLFVSNPRLTFLSSSCTSSTLNPVYSLVASIIEPYHGESATFYHFYYVGVCVSLISSEYSTWRQSTLKPWGHDLNRALVYPSYPNVPEKIIVERANVQFSLEVPARWRMSPLTLGYEKVHFPFWAFARVVEPRRSNDGVQHK